MKNTYIPPKSEEEIKKKKEINRILSLVLLGFIYSFIIIYCLVLSSQNKSFQDDIEVYIQNQETLVKSIQELEKSLEFERCEKIKAQGLLKYENLNEMAKGDRYVKNIKYFNQLDCSCE